MNSARILLAGGGAETKAALEHAFSLGAHEVTVVHEPEADDALVALVSERFQLCLVRTRDNHPQFPMLFCRDAKEAGVRVPIVILMDVVNADKERELLSTGAMAALPWDGSQEAMLRNLVNLTLGLRQSEDNLRQSNDRLLMEMRTLQDERERAEAVNMEYVELMENYAIAKTELEKLNQEKNKFFSIIAHDLRSPFTALLGFSSLLADRVDHLEPGKIRDFANHINESGNRVFKLLENLLEWSRLQMDRVTVEPRRFSVAEVAAKTIEILGPVAKEKSISISEQGQTPEAYADPHMIDAVIRNLVNNAIKFTPKGGNITIGYETDLDAGYARISVKDTGVGMNLDKAKKLFSLSEAVTTQGTAGEQGTGLGLLLCKELVERNNGRITVESEPGRGSTFTFTVPLPDPKSLDHSVLAEPPKKVAQG
jgi:signal transduction histidine kinase